MTSVHRELLGGRYELQTLIAAGGMGEVWRGRDVRFDRPVAVKVLRSEYAADPDFAARFRAEATHAAGLSHPNIAAVHDYGETRTEATGEKIAYLVMELVDGEPLSALFRDGGPLDTQTALSVLRQAAAALAEAHRAGVVHRDVKPANILIDRDGQVKLTDFGIAWSAASVPLTRTGQVIGTPQYMSPEQATGEAPRPASDVYALGLIGYESLTGHAAFDGDNPVTIALKQVRQQPEPLPDDVPDEVRSLIDAAITKDPDARFPDGDAFLEAIDATLDDVGTAGSGTRALPVARGTAPRTAPVPVGARRAAREERRAPVRQWTGPNTRLAAVVLALVLLGGGGVAVGTAMGLPGEEPSPAGSAAAVATPVPGAFELTASDHVGRPADEVAADLEALGLAVERLDRVTSDHEPGTVAALEPVGAQLVAGDTVLLHVAVAPARATPPEGSGAGTSSAPGGGGAAGVAGGSASPGTGGEGAAAAEGAPAPTATDEPAGETSAGGEPAGEPAPTTDGTGTDTGDGATGSPDDGTTGDVDPSATPTSPAEPTGEETPSSPPPTEDEEPTEEGTTEEGTTGQEPSTSSTTSGSAEETPVAG